MKTSINWLKFYTSIPDDLEAWQQRMIMTGTAVESIQRLDQNLQGVVVGRVVSCNRHENSDHLHVCHVDVGGESPLQVVCGAPNVQAGQLVPTALVGATLPGGLTIKAGKIRGVESFGMLCSATELMVPQDLYPSVGEAGLLILEEGHTPGSDVRAILGLDDALVEVEVLANRPDCLSVLGLARESAAAHNTDITLPSTDFKSAAESIDSQVSIQVESPELCARYAGKVIRNVRIGPSPRWLQRCLYAAGIRPINNIVDITNFVMLETGHPMHAFDLGRVNGRQIIVRNALPGEGLTTLDGKQHTMQGHELMICDAKGPIGLAGIMGGLDSEITQDTRDILLECAAFDRTNTRITARGLGIRTEASARFERGISPRTVLWALERACHLVDALSAGDIAQGVIDLYPHPQPRIAIRGSVQRIARLSGVSLSGQEMLAMLQRLQFDVSLDGDCILATAPDWRQDIEGEADLCEEVLRLAGYDRIQATLLRGETTPGGDSVGRLQQHKLSGILNGLGYDEILNFSFFGRKQLDSLNLALDDPRLDAIMIRNPLGEDTQLMRTTLAPDMLRVLALNMNHGNAVAMLYEYGMLHDANARTTDGLPVERRALSLGAYGKDIDFYTVRDAVLLLLAREGIAYGIDVAQEPFLHPGRSAVITASASIVATVGEVHPDIRESYGMTERAWIAQINLELMSKLALPLQKVDDLPRMPSVNRDIALVLDESQPLLPVMEAIRRAGGKTLEDVVLFDVYRGAQLGESKKSAAFALTLRSADHTLTESEISTVMDKVHRSLKAQFGASVRS